MSNTDIRNLSIEDIQARLEEAENQYHTLKMRHKISPIENPITVRQSRREIARYKTILTEKQAEQK